MNKGQHSIRCSSYHCAVDGQRAVVQLADAVADPNVDPTFAPLDCGQRVSPYLTVQDGVATQRFNTVGVLVSINDWRLWGHRWRFEHSSHDLNKLEQCATGTF